MNHRATPESQGKPFLTKIGAVLRFLPILVFLGLRRLFLRFPREILPPIKELRGEDVDMDVGADANIDMDVDVDIHLDVDADVEFWNLQWASFENLDYFLHGFDCGEEVFCVHTLLAELLYYFY